MTENICFRLVFDTKLPFRRRNVKCIEKNFRKDFTILAKLALPHILPHKTHFQRESHISVEVLKIYFMECLRASKRTKCVYLVIERGGAIKK